MVINLGFTGKRPFAGSFSSAQRKKAAVNFTGDSLKQHERIMGLNSELARATSDLQSALMSLSAANIEIDRLNSKVASLEAELESARGKAEAASARAQKTTRKKKCTASSDVK